MKDYSNFVIASILTVGTLLYLRCANLEESRQLNRQRRQDISKEISRQDNIIKRKAAVEMALAKEQELGYIIGTVTEETRDPYYNAYGNLEGNSKGTVSGGAGALMVGGFGIGVGSISGNTKGEIKGMYESKHKAGYFLGIKTDDRRKLGIQVLDTERVKASALDIIVERGTRIRFPAGNLDSVSPPCNCTITYFNEETVFYKNTRIGTKRANRIEVLD